MAVWWGCISRRKKGRGRRWTDVQPLSDKPLLIRCGEITFPSGSDLNIQQNGHSKKSCVLC